MVFFFGYSLVLNVMSNETHDATPKAEPPVVCPGCGAELPSPKLAQLAPAPLVGYHHCRACGLVWREQPAKTQKNT
jgi:hypothetical protein